MVNLDVVHCDVMHNRCQSWEYDRSPCLHGGLAGEILRLDRMVDMELHMGMEALCWHDIRSLSMLNSDHGIDLDVHVRQDLDVHHHRWATHHGVSVDRLEEHVHWRICVRTCNYPNSISTCIAEMEIRTNLGKVFANVISGAS
jgi:hypothetical protein